MSPLASIIAAVILHLTPQVSAPDAGKFAVAIEDASVKYHMDWPLLTAILYRESRFQEKNISHTNDFGIGQHHCPSFYCARKPTAEQRACLLDAACNIDLTAQELTRAKDWCRRKGKGCKDWVQLYNASSKGYAQRTRFMMRNIERMAAKEKSRVDADAQASRIASRPVL